MTRLISLAAALVCAGLVPGLSAEARAGAADKRLDFTWVDVEGGRRHPAHHPRRRDGADRHRQPG